MTRRQMFMGCGFLLSGLLTWQLTLGCQTESRVVSWRDSETLSIAGDDGDPEDAYPLGRCAGDCDDDDDCDETEGLVCFQRSGTEAVPGCTGSGVSGKDYCYNPATGTECGDGGCDVSNNDASNNEHIRIVAIGDLHGDFSALAAALTVGGVIDSTLAWTGAHTIVVQTGDILDRGHDEREIMDFLQALRAEARVAGGDVIQLMGNHELMNLDADYRYVSPGSCEAFADLPDLDLEQPELDDPVLADLPESCRQRAAALLPGGPYAQILAGFAVAIVVADNLFAHGSLLPEHLAERSLDQINAELRTWALGEGGSYAIAEDIAWDRSFSDGEQLPPETCDALAQVLGQVGAARLIVGHTIQENTNAACDGDVWRIDVGMSEHYGGEVEVLEIVGDVVTVLD